MTCPTCDKPATDCRCNWPDNQKSVGAGMEAPKDFPSEWPTTHGHCGYCGALPVDCHCSHTGGMLCDEIGGEVETAVWQYAEVCAERDELKARVALYKHIFESVGIALGLPEEGDRMSHECPECYQTCYCNGDIDDCRSDDEEAIIKRRSYHDEA